MTSQPPIIPAKTPKCWLYRISGFCEKRSIVFHLRNFQQIPLRCVLHNSLEKIMIYHLFSVIQCPLTCSTKEIRSDFLTLFASVAQCRRKDERTTYQITTNCYTGISVLSPGLHCLTISRNVVSGDFGSKGCCSKTGFRFSEI